MNDEMAVKLSLFLPYHQTDKTSPKSPFRLHPHFWRTLCNRLKRTRPSFPTPEQKQGLKSKGISKLAEKQAIFFRFSHFIFHFQVPDCNVQIAIRAFNMRFCTLFQQKGPQTSLPKILNATWGVGQRSVRQLATPHAA